jgi:hypothetical protein
MKTGDGREGTSTREASRRGREKEGESEWLEGKVYRRRNNSNKKKKNKHETETATAAMAPRH